MKKVDESHKKMNSDEIVNFIEGLLEEKGKEALEVAQNEVLQERFESKEIQNALKYFMNDYWHDLARPALISLVCESVGGNPETTKHFAVSMILISGAIDIHDDIIDESRTKESRATVLGKFGNEIALIVGDVLLFKGFTHLYNTVEKGVPIEKVSVIMNIIKETFFKLGDAEASELEFRGCLDTTPEQYIHVVKNKATDVEAYTKISGIIAGGSSEEIKILAKFGNLLGMLIILRDDLIDMINFEEMKNRIKNEHLPLPILYALHNPKFKSSLCSILKKQEVSENDVETIFELTEKAGGFKSYRKQMEKIAEDILLKIEKLNYNKLELSIFIKSILLPLDKL